MFGFKSVDDYYSKSSSIDDLENVRVPSLFINSRNDLLSPIDTVNLEKCKLN